MHLNMERQNIKTIEENMRESLHDPEVAKDLLNMTHKALIIKENLASLDHIEIKSFCLKDNSKRIKEQTTE